MAFVSELMLLKYLITHQMLMNSIFTKQKCEVKYFYAIMLTFWC